MIPQGTGWQQLRGMALDAVPQGIRVFYKTAIPLHEWRTRGVFQINLCSKKLIKFETTAAEIGATLLADTELLLDHAAEQQAVLHDALVGAAWHSPSWALVTEYYWAFFSTLALTRLTGRSIWFLDRAALGQFRALAGSADQPSAGAMSLRLDPYVSATIREFSLSPSKSQFHDAVWTALSKLVNEVFQHSDQNGNALEYRLWAAIKSVSDKWGADWPSKIRNAVNYRPGFAYREVVRHNQIDTMKFIRKNAPLKFDEIIEYIEDDSLSVHTGTTAVDAPELANRLLSLTCMALTGIVSALHAEVIERQAGDIRWRNRRSQFCVERSPTADGSIWPFAE